ncbi:MAG: hypothetical protein KME46_33250 [Brasilonema angustatum HA4187-MV1]|jgi:hypothetical protein|nr:hypothetical protein [Brasilonema angustatum HA4187-MV1]
MLVNKELIVNQINEDWGNKPQSQICISVLNYLLDTSTENRSHITFGSLKIAVNNQHTDIELLKAIQYLCGERTKLLEINFEFIQDEENIFPLSNTEVKIAKETGELIHPETGEIINNYEEKVFMYFEPSYLVKKISK